MARQQKAEDALLIACAINDHPHVPRGNLRPEVVLNCSMSTHPLEVTTATAVLGFVHSGQNGFPSLAAATSAAAWATASTFGSKVGESSAGAGLDAVVGCRDVRSDSGKATGSGDALEVTP